MILRRLMGVGLAAVLTAGPMLVSSAPSATAATKPGYVAVVISGHGTHCVRWTSGITGDTVLNAVATVGYRSDGLIVQIDGDPSSGTADSSHYWSYWHDTTSAWTYSNYGASSYDPPAGSVEGWSYDNGNSSPPKPAQNPSGLYAKTCGAKDATASGGGTAPAPTTSASTTSAPSRPASTRAASTDAASTHAASTHSATTHAASTDDPSAAPSSAQSTRPTGPSYRHGSTRSGSAPARTAQHLSGPASTASSPPVSSNDPVSTAPGTIDASPASASASAGSPTGLLVGLGLAIVLAAGAGVVALRRRDAGH